ncbi:type II CRISPR RNA-guided endonuclease Cas9 [Bacillus sp. FSL R9-9530]|uniref:type II CRISPR RNA-guided endonuclease Cas9 n=1 Tax=Bacillus sp. FSL R9-9530 TaxID=2921593 RepID=UPI0030F59EE4
MRYVLGLDIGIASCGWAVINQEKERIEDLGVRIFDKAENPKDGKSLAAPRRDARSTRRTLRRKKHRMQRIKILLVKQGLLSKTELNHLYESATEVDVWNLRLDALERKLNPKEFTRVLIHLAKRRGFKSNRKETTLSENGQILESISENQQIMEQQNYRTVGEMILKDKKFENHKRNKDGTYIGTVTRQQLQDEIQMIFHTQRLYKNDYATEEFESSYLEIWASQRPYASKDQIEKMIGYCTLEPKEKRTPTASWSFQYFVALQTINNLRLISKDKIEELSFEEKKQIMNLALEKPIVKYIDIRKLLSIPNEFQFNSLSYSADTVDTTLENKRCIELKEYHSINKVYKQVYGKNTPNLLPIDYDTIAYGLTIFKDDKDILEYLQNKYVNAKGKPIKNLAKKTYDDTFIQALLNLNFTKMGHLSFKALKNIIPFLEEGLSYDKACEKAGYNFKGTSYTERTKYLPVIPQNTNPVVHRALSQTRKVINAIIKKYGSPNAIHIETARELSKTFQERKEIDSRYQDNSKKNEHAIHKLKELGNINPSGINIVKFKLWSEQDGRCMYSGKYIEPHRLFEEGYTEVDHILPYSRSLDDSYNNKTLTLGTENQRKANKTPYEYMGNTSIWDEFETRVQSNKKINFKKQQKLLLQNFSYAREQEFIERNLNDTRYATIYLTSLIQQHLIFSESSSKKKVRTVSGIITSHLRSRWGFNKDRKEGHIHHALDAVIVAVTSDDMIQRVTKYYKLKELNRNLQAKRLPFPEPWEGFRLELEARISPNTQQYLKGIHFKNYADVNLSDIKPIFVSRMPKRSITGELHQETIRKFLGYNEKGKVLTAIKTKLEDIPFDANGDFPMYGKETDLYTYNAIKERYLSHEKDKRKSFQEPLYKPTKSGEIGPLIKSIKIMDTRTIVNPVNQGKGVVYNSKIARTDVFKKEDKYYLIPIYTIDLLKNILPQKAITAGKGYEDWTTIDSSFTFLFSLFPNDLIQIVPSKNKTIKARTTVSKNEVLLPSLIGYFKGVHSGTAGITVETHDGSVIANVGSKQLLLFEKYQVDVLGHYTKIKEEKRMGMAI